jgi:hypothetical protein
MDLIKFDPTIEQLQVIVEITKRVGVDSAPEIIHENRLKLRDVRIRIEKTGKKGREEYLAAQKAIIGYEKELLAIITPEEDRLKAIEDEAKLIKERAARAALLPMRLEQLSALGYTIMDTEGDDWLLDMDNDEFIAFLNTKKAEKLDRDMAEVAAQKAKLEREAEIAAAKESARIFERERIEAATKANEERRIQAEAQKKYDTELAAQKLIDDAKSLAAKIESDAREAIRREEINKAFEEQTARDKQAKREKEERYVLWLTKIGYTETEHGSWYFDTKEDVTNAYKLISSFKNL